MTVLISFRKDEHATLGTVHMMKLDECGVSTTIGLVANHALREVAQWTFKGFVANCSSCVQVR